MKKITVKIIAVLAAVVLLTAAMAPAVFAEDFLGDLGNFSELLGGGFDLGGIADIIGGLLNGGGNTTPGITLSDIFSNPNAMEYIKDWLGNMNIDTTTAALYEAIAQVLAGYGNADLSTIPLGNDFLNQLAEYLKENQTTTRPAEEPSTRPTPDETTTEEESSTEPTTAYEIPTIIIPSTYVYQGADTYSTQPAPTTTEPVYSFTYQEQPTQYMEPATTVPFVANYEENTKAVSDNSTKLMIGAAIVLLSAGAIVVVAVMLKKTKA